MTESHPMTQDEFPAETRTKRGPARHSYPATRRSPSDMVAGAKKTEAFIEAALMSAQEECLLWPYRLGGWGYPEIIRSGKIFRVNRLVCQRAHGAPPTDAHEAAHNCGKPECLNPRHLRWATHAENLADKLIHGTHNRGERHNFARLTETQVREIRAQRGLCPQVNLARMYGVSKGAIQNVMDGTTWGWLNG